MLGRMLGIEGPLGMYTWFTIAVAISARVAPPYAKLAALEQQLEGRFRARHANLVQATGERESEASILDRENCLEL